MKAKIIISVSLCIALAMSSCGNNSPKDASVEMIKNPNSAQGYDNSEKMPAITFETDIHDFGRLSAGENISYSFKFTNTGKADLIISGCKPSCGCTVANYPKDRIAPGQTGYITVSLQSAGLSGQQMKEVMVLTNAQPSRTRIRITADVR